MPDNNINIEELVKSINSGYEKQLQAIQKLTEKRDAAIDDGDTAQYIDILNSEIDRLSESVNTQRKSTESFYNEMVRLSGGRTDLDKKMLQDSLEFRVKYLELQERLDELDRQYESEKSKVDENGKSIANQAELDWNQKEYSKTLKEQIKLEKDLKDEYGEHSYAAISANEFIANQLGEQEELHNVIAEAEEGHINKARELGKAYADNKKRLEETKEIWRIIKNSIGAVWAQVKDGGNLWLKYNAQAINDAKRLGMTSREEAMGYMETLMENSKTLSRNFGMTAEQAMKMQDVYSKVTGRATLLTQSQMEDIAASSKLMGDETVQGAIKIMDSIGTTSQTTTELLDKNFARALNRGLDTVEASREFVKNMTLANKLTFRNGVDGISKMTVLSQTIKMNLQEVANVADKFSTIEGAIEGAAQLQMLGGPVAMLGSNPMQMLYESLSDPEALFERIKKMASTQATFNRKTGEAYIDPMTMSFMKEQEKALGLSSGTLITSAKQQAKLRSIEGDWRMYSPSSFANATKEQKAAVENKAEFDKELGTWVVKYLDEKNEQKKVSVQEITTKQLLDITKDNIKPIDDIRLRVREIAKELVGTKERFESMKDQWKTGIGQLISPIMKFGDSALNIINSSGFWKGVVGGGGLTLGALGALGVGKLGIGLGKYKIGKTLGNKVLSYFASRMSVGGGGNQIPKNIIPPNVGIKGIASNQALSEIKSASDVSKTFKLLRLGGNTPKALKGGGAGLSVVAGVLTGVAGWMEADAIKASSDKRIRLAQERNTRFSRDEFIQRSLAAENKQKEGRAGAVGEGVGVTGGAIGGAILGAKAGALIGTAFGPLGTAAGATIGGAIGGIAGGIAGGMAGKDIGKSLAGKKDLDVVGTHIEEIEKSDEKENFRRIVLPVESIDYNVSLIANKLDVSSASPARGNIYLDAEAAGHIYAEGKPLEASEVNKKDGNMNSAANQPYKPAGPLTLNINGSIELNMKGNNVGNISATEFKKIFENNPEIQRYIVEVVTKGQVRNGNSGGYNNENSNNRRGTGYNQNRV